MSYIRIRNLLLAIAALFTSVATIAQSGTAVVFPPTTNTYPNPCEIFAGTAFGADGGTVYFARGGFFNRDNTEWFGTAVGYQNGCVNYMVLQFNPQASGVAFTLRSFVDDTITVSSASGNTDYTLAAGGSVVVTVPGPTQGISFTPRASQSYSFAITSLIVERQTSTTLPGDITFDITDASSANDRRVLISNAHFYPGTSTPAYPYPHFQSLLARDRSILVTLQTLYGGAGTAGIPVTLRVIDPPDPSEYIVGSGNWQGQPVPGAALSHTNDNVGPLPLFHGNCAGCATYSVTSGANGYVRAELDLDPASRAGDNYQVEATATFPSGATKTVRSAVITAWKRMFVEKKQMYRQGVPLATDAPAGTQHIYVPDVDISDAAGDRLQNNDAVSLMHAPPFGTPKTASSYYSGYYSIAAHPRRVTIPTSGYPVPGKGTITTNGTATIVGIATHFHAQVREDDVINIADATGQTERRWVLSVTDNTHLTVNAPPTISGAGLAYSIGDANLLPGAAYVQLTLDRALTESYQREPLVPVSTGVLALNDAVVRTAATTPGPLEVFDTDDAFLTGGAEAQWGRAFPAAYTEYVVLPTQAPSAVPRVLFPGNDALVQWFVDKWFATPAASVFTGTPPPAGQCGVAQCGMLAFTYVVPPNHQLILVGDSSSNSSDLGQTALVSWQTLRQRATVIYRGLVESRSTNPASQLYQMDPANTTRRNEIHELAHQWDVNPARPGFHCSSLAYDSAGTYPASGTVPPSTTHFCVMAVDPTTTYPAPWNSAMALADTNRAYEDPHTAFHMFLANGWNSEYLTIRNVPDPWNP